MAGSLRMASPARSDRLGPNETGSAPSNSQVLWGRKEYLLSLVLKQQQEGAITPLRFPHVCPYPPALRRVPP